MKSQHIHTNGCGRRFYVKDTDVRLDYVLDLIAVGASVSEVSIAVKVPESQLRESIGDISNLLRKVEGLLQYVDHQPAAKV